MLLPLAFGAIAIAEYHYVPNADQINVATNVYIYFLLILMGLVAIANVISLFSSEFYKRLRHSAPFYSLVFVLFIGYDMLTLKTRALTLPFFPWVDSILNNMIDDRGALLDCALNSLKLLFTGYIIGCGVGVITGIACGYSRKIDYWLNPFMKLLGAIPTTTWIPVVMVIAASLFQGAVFIIALGSWFAVALATITGIRGIDGAYYEAARTLGATGKQLVVHIAIPSAVPSIFSGLTQAMSSACTALITAEMIGVESGLGWYITWQKNWAQYGKMYAAIVIICVIFVLVNWILGKIKEWVLRWQKGLVRE